MKRHPAQRTGLHDQFVTALGRLALDLEPVGFDELSTLVKQHGLFCYDAAYLWLALAYRVPLLTFDRKLATAHRKAAQQAG